MRRYGTAASFVVSGVSILYNAHVTQLLGYNAQALLVSGVAVMLLVAGGYLAALEAK